MASQWLKLIECKYSPSQVFTIFDYTKIAYPIDSGFYLKEVVVADEKTTFIQIKHQFDTIHAIHGTLNNLVAVEQKADYYYVGFYGAVTDEIRVRLTLQLQGKLSVRTVYCDNMLMMCFTAEDGLTNEIIFMDCKQKVPVARGFVQGAILDMCIGPNCSLSLYLPKHVVCYKNQPLLDEQTITRVYKETEANITLQFQHHFWIQDELFVWGKNKGCIIIKNKLCQQFENFHRLHNAVPLTCGFLACDGCVIKIFKKKNIRYELICEIIDEHLMECKNLVLSPQQDILAYYTPVSEALVVASTFSEQVEEAQLNDNPLQMAINLKSKEISHVKSYDYTVYSSSQAWFAAVNGTQIKLTSSTTYQQFLSIELAEEGEKNYMSSDLKPRHVCIHPNRPILAVALKTKIKIYYVSFNDIKVLKEINVSMCGYLTFNHSGSLLTAVVSGKGGAKLYIYKVNEFKSDFSLLETITIGRRPINVEWDSLDAMLYCFFNEGYYQWTLQSKFKMRRQCLFNFKFEVSGAILDKEDNPIFWGNESLVPVASQKLGEYQTVKQKIKYIFVEGQYYIIAFENGKIGRNKNLDLQSCFSKSFDLCTKGRKFQVRLQETNKLFYLSQDLNVKFYQFGSIPNTFTNIIGIDKKKLYSILNKHQYYEAQIKKIRQDFTQVLQQYKAKSAAQQQRIENEYKYELKDHVERQKKVKEEKAKLEELMESNIQIKERESINQIKELERLYERKIALTTNKLLTEKEIGFRDKMTAEAKLKILQQKHYTDVEQIRKEFSQHLKLYIVDRNETQREINNIKKQYETRLYELEQQNQILLKEIQQKNETSLVTLKKMINNWQNKYSQCMSQKDNIEKEYQNQLVNCDKLKEKISSLEIRKQEAERRCQNLSNQIVKVQRVLEERNKTIQFYEKRIEDLEKSNEILKYRVLEVKEQNDPYEAEITKLKQNMTDLQQEYDKLLKSSYEQQQKMQIIKKQKSKLKQDVEVIGQKYMKLSKRHEELLDKVRETTKSPIQQIRRQLLAIVDSYARINKSYSNMQKRADSPLGELNRIRDHLEVCLDEAMTANKKNEEQKRIQITKKNRENSQLIIEINTMRKRIKVLEGEIRDKNVQISRLMRGQTATVVSKDDKDKERDRIETTQAQSKQFTKTKSRERETFYEKGMFRSGTHWNQRRLKTQQEGRRKKSSLSMMREKNQNFLAIHPQAEEIEQYKRIIEQKDIFIQKLIVRIQKTS